MVSRRSARRTAMLGRVLDAEPKIIEFIRCVAHPFEL
jgi:hypothetical protein